MILVAAVVALVGCGAKQQTLSLVNKTPRKITEIYVYRIGASDHGASRGALAPNAQMTLKLPVGHLEVRAISERIQLDDHQGETREASTAVQLKKSPVELVFHDSNQPPPPDRPNTIGVVFRVPPEPATPDDTTPEPPPAE